MNKILSAFLVLVIIMRLSTGVVDADYIEMPQYTAAEIFMTASILRGSDKGYELDRYLTRLEGLVLVIRLLGEEEEALTYDGEDLAFNDVPFWGRKYVDYATEVKLIRGVTSTRFGSKDSMHYNSFCTLMLRILGYSEDAGDFDWYTVPRVADALGISLAKDFSKSSLTRNDAVDIMMKTLNTQMKDSELQLIGYLVEEKKMDVNLAGLIDSRVFEKSRVSGPNSSVLHLPESPIPAVIAHGDAKTETEPSEEGDKSNPSEPEPIISPSDKDSNSLIVEMGAAIRASDAGMVPNDISEAHHNAQLLNQAINEHGDIIIDDVYYIGDSAETVNRKDIRLSGYGNAELVFIISKTKILFGRYPLDTLKVSNVKFTNLSDSQEVILVYSRASEPTYIEEVSYDQCIFTGNISAFRQKGNKYKDPRTHTFGIDRFLFTNNRVTDTQISFLHFIDLPFNEIVISNNEIHNFQQVFANISLTNGIKYGNVLQEMRRFIRVNNNTVINDDEWWAEAEGLYHCFLLAENKEVIYKNNHVEGLKSRVDIALYDAYLSSKDVSYVGNTWINNICFVENKNNTLIKAKSSHNGVRLYEGNTFIVEEAYAERLGQSKEHLYVQFIDINHDMKSFKINDNFFDLYDVRFQTSSRDVEILEFNHNEMNAIYASGKMFIPRLVDEHQSSITFKGNIINIEQDAYRQVSNTSSHNEFGFIEVVDARSSDMTKALYLSMTGNQLVVPIVYGFHRPICDYAEVFGNQILVVEHLFKGLSYGGNQPELESLEVQYQSLN